MWCNDLTSISTVSCGITVYLSGCSVPDPDRSKQYVRRMSRCSTTHFKLHKTRTPVSWQENVRKLLSQTSVTLDSNWTLFPCIWPSAVSCLMLDWLFFRHLSSLLKAFWLINTKKSNTEFSAWTWYINKIKHLLRVFTLNLSVCLSMINCVHFTTTSYNTMY